MGEQLERTLNLPMLLLIGINTIMGTGVFFLPALGAGNAGTASLISWGIIGVISIYVSLCFAELASVYPSSGGLYEYCKHAFGPFPAFLVGWGTLIAGNVTIAMLIVGAVRYLNPALPQVYKVAVSLFFVLILNFVTYEGMELSGIMLVGFSILTLSTFMGVLVPALLNVEWTNYASFPSHGTAEILITAFLIAETFFGWETITELSEETHNARRYIPIALVASTCAVAVMAFIYSFASIGALGAETFGGFEAPFSAMAAVFYGEQASAIFTLLVYLCIVGSVAGFVVPTPRLILKLAEDKLFISQMAAVHPEKKTPHNAIIFQTVLTSALVVVGSGSYEALLKMLLPLLLTLYATVVLAVVVLRRKQEWDPYITAPGGAFGPIICAAAMFGLVVLWAVTEPGALATLQVLFSILFFGVPIYFLLVFYYNPNAIVGFHDYFSRLSLWLENIILPSRVRERMLDLFDDLEGADVLEFGSGVGTLTMDLADHVGPEGKVYAADLSEKSLEILQERLDRKGIEHVETVHDVHLVNRVHPNIGKVDFVFSVGVLSYLQDPDTVLKDVGNVLENGGKLCFVEYVNFFGFLPDPAWISDQYEVEQLFRDAGFSVRVKREKGWLWNYLLVYGFKSDEDVPFV